jgi:histidine triad (HIT) family protein
MDCLFCKIARGEIPAKQIYQDDKVVAFDDINPQAPQHKIIIPRKHIASLNELAAGEEELTGYLLHIAANLAKQLGIAEDGYRVVLNCNANGGQTVFHLHAHLLGGRAMAWPPG